MKYLRRWIESTFPNVAVKVSDSGSLYYNLDGCLSIRMSNHFSPVPRNRISIEIVQSLNDERFAIRYKKSLSFFLYDRATVKNVISAMYDANRSERMVQRTDEDIIEAHRDRLIKKYTKPLPLTKMLIGKGNYNNVVTSKKSSAAIKALEGCEMFTAQSDATKKVLRKAFDEGIKGVLLLDLVIRAYSAVDLNEVKNIIDEMKEYKTVISMMEKERHAKEVADRLVEEATKH